jgi:hypothetical protein
MRNMFLDIDFPLYCLQRLKPLAMLLSKTGLINVQHCNLFSQDRIDINSGLRNKNSPLAE